MKVKDLTGKRFGRLLVLARFNFGKKGRVYWVCVCDCGVFKVVVGNALSAGRTKSCGCYAQECRILNNTIHGKSKGQDGGRAYSVWSSMINRTTNPNCNRAEYYINRGIGVSDEWRSFVNFYNDMGEPPKGMWLERIDNNLGYSKENCKWASISEQSSNRRRPSSNGTGKMGVHYDSSVNKYRATIVVNGVRHDAGRFQTLEAAIKAVEDMELKYLGRVRG